MATATFKYTVKTASGFTGSGECQINDDQYFAIKCLMSSPEMTSVGKQQLADLQEKAGRYDDLCR